jgi:hypothetical protein
MSGSIAGRFDLVNMTGADSREFETFRDGYAYNPPCRQVAVCGQKKIQPDPHTDGDRAREQDDTRKADERGWRANWPF